MYMTERDWNLSLSETETGCVYSEKVGSCYIMGNKSLENHIPHILGCNIHRKDPWKTWRERFGKLNLWQTTKNNKQLLQYLRWHQAFKTISYETYIHTWLRAAAGAGGGGAWSLKQDTVGFLFCLLLFHWRFPIYLSDQVIEDLRRQQREKRWLSVGVRSSGTWPAIKMTKVQLGAQQLSLQISQTDLRGGGGGFASGCTHIEDVDLWLSRGL